MCIYLCVCAHSKQVEKEKRELARQYGMVRNEVSGGEIAEELEKERRSFQLSMCEVSHCASSSGCYITYNSVLFTLWFLLPSFFLLPIIYLLIFHSSTLLPLLNLYLLSILLRSMR